VRRRYDGDNTGNIDDKEMMQALHELGVLDPKVDPKCCLFHAQCRKAKSLIFLLSDLLPSFAWLLLLVQCCPEVGCAVMLSFMHTMVHIYLGLCLGTAVGLSV